MFTARPQWPSRWLMQREVDCIQSETKPLKGIYMQCNSINQKRKIDSSSTCQREHDRLRPHTDEALNGIWPMELEKNLIKCTPSSSFSRPRHPPPFVHPALFLLPHPFPQTNQFASLDPVLVSEPGPALFCLISRFIFTSTEGFVLFVTVSHNATPAGHIRRQHLQTCTIANHNAEFSPRITNDDSIAIVTATIAKWVDVRAELEVCNLYKDPLTGQNLRESPATTYCATPSLIKHGKLTFCSFKFLCCQEWRAASFTRWFSWLWH